MRLRHRILKRLDTFAHTHLWVSSRLACWICDRYEASLGGTAEEREAYRLGRWLPDE